MLLIDNLAYRIKNLSADNGIVMIFFIELIDLTSVYVESELEVRVGFLIKAVPNIPFVT